ncbi:DUF1858 domain-containing protein [Candidatus Pacearchaeota archaeon]|nr:MAG: DUF1858 domain-containing protein [Candidatus Pacearchaeota archaeon]
MKITKNTTFAEIIDNNPELLEELSQMGLFCGGCPMAAFETIEMGALGHGMDPNDVIEKLKTRQKESRIEEENH